MKVADFTDCVFYWIFKLEGIGMIRCKYPWYIYPFIWKHSLLYNFSLWIAGWKIYSAYINILWRIYSRIQSRVAPDTCDVEYNSSSCVCWCNHVHCYNQNGISWTNSLYRSCKCCRTDNWFNKNSKYCSYCMKISKRILLPSPISYNYLLSWSFQVVSFTAEKQSLTKYRGSLQSAYDSSIQEGLAAGLGMGTAMFLFFCGYSLGIWYGAKLILNEDYTGGNVFSVIFAVLTGSL